MNLYKWVAVFTLGMFLLSGAQAADKYVADAAHTNVGFNVKHMVITNVSGKFKKFDVVFHYDENNPANSSMKATIQAASIDTDNEKRDNHLRSSDFLAVEEYPEITFVSQDIQPNADGYLAVGELTIRGVTRQVEMPFKILGKIKDPYGNTRLGAEAALTINRHDFGVNWNKTLDSGGLVVGDSVNIVLDVEMIREG